MGTAPLCRPWPVRSAKVARKKSRNGLARRKREAWLDAIEGPDTRAADVGSLVLRGYARGGETPFSEESER